MAELVRKGLDKVPAAWGADVKSLLVPILSKRFLVVNKNQLVLGNGYVSNLGRSGETFLFCPLATFLIVRDAK